MEILLVPQIPLAYLDTCPDGNRKGYEHQQERYGNQDPSTDTNSFPPVGYKTIWKRSKMNVNPEKSCQRNADLANCNHYGMQSPQSQSLSPPSQHSLKAKYITKDPAIYIFLLHERLKDFVAEEKQEEWKALPKLGTWRNKRSGRISAWIWITEKVCYTWVGDLVCTKQIRKIRGTPPSLDRGFEGYWQTSPSTGRQAASGCLSAHPGTVGRFLIALSSSHQNLIILVPEGKVVVSCCSCTRSLGGSL